jgi:hypothetical protein
MIFSPRRLNGGLGTWCGKATRPDHLPGFRRDAPPIVRSPEAKSGSYCSELEAGDALYRGETDLLTQGPFWKIPWVRIWDSSVYSDNAEDTRFMLTSETPSC